MPSKKQIIVFNILFLFFTGCMPKENGKYHTKYTYHPYYSLYTKDMSNKPPKINVASSKKEKSIFSLNIQNRFPN